MKQFQDASQWVNSWRRRPFVLSFFRAAILLFTLAATVAAHAQSAPKLVSVTPADGATDVATNSTIVFVFDQDMDPLKPPFPSIPPALVGNYEFQPSSLNLTFTHTWSADKRALTFKRSQGLPYDTNISWTLNPPGETAGLPQLSSVSGQVLATASGSFKTAVYIPPPPVPKLLSVVPTNNATEVSPISPVTFVFDQEMDTSTTLLASTPSVIGNYQFASFGLVGSFTGSWSPDKRTLTFQPTTPIALNSIVTWRLNPTGTTVPLKSAMGQPLAFANGSYTIISNTGGGANEICPTNTSVGYYTLTKTIAHTQTSANNVVPSLGAPASFFTFVQNPPVGKGRATGGSAGIVTNASLTLPNSIVIVFTNQSLIVVTNLRGGGVITNRVGPLGLYPSPTTEAALESAYPPGSYTMRFDRVGLPESVIPMNMPAAPTSIPMIANYDEAQAINAAQSFTLRWTSFSPQSAGAFINVIITDEFGKLLFQAPNLCVPRMLFPTDTSVVIPANYFKAGLNYNGTLQFGFNFYNSTSDVPGMVGYGVVERTTSFSLKTGASTGGAAPPEAFTGYRVLANGHPELNLSATAGKSFTIQRTGSLSNPNWSVAGNVTMNASGTAVFEDSDTTLKFPAFYRAVSSGPTR